MTAYGERVTPKENLDDSYLVVPRKPGSLVNDELLDEASDWEHLNAKEHALHFDNFHFAHYHFSQALPRHVNLKASEDLVFMQFCLLGNCSYRGDKRTMLFKNSEHNILCIPKGQSLVFTNDADELEIVNVYFDSEFLLKYIPKNHLVADRISEKSPGTVIASNLAIGPKMQSVIQDIKSCAFEGHLKKLYTQAKIIELLTLQLAQFEESTMETPSLKPSDIDKMMLVKELIEQHLDQPMSLSYLARNAGTNEQYLKKHFKIMFGSTVFNHILSLKMERAKNMLLEGKHKVAEVAVASGYKHATHFSGAFKKYFGYLPNKIKIACLAVDPDWLTAIFMNN